MLPPCFYRILDTYKYLLSSQVYWKVKFWRVMSAHSARTRVRMAGGFALGAEPKPWKYERTKSPGGENFLRPLPPGEEISPGGPTL